MTKPSHQGALAAALGVLSLAFSCSPKPPSTDGAGGTAATSGGGTAATDGGGGSLQSGGANGAGGSGAAATGGTSSGGAPGGGGSTGVLADVTVRAGPLGRDHTIVSFPYAAGPAQLLALRDAAGTELPLQIDSSGVATFILPALDAGAEATFTLVEPALPPSVGATATEVDGAIRLAVGDMTVADFRITENAPVGVDPLDVRAGYLHPVRTPAGTVVTDDYRDGDEGGGHAWHHGIWTGWTRTDFEGRIVDFWNTYKGEGKVDLESVESTWQGPVHAGLDAKLIHVDLLGGGVTAMNERWLLRAYRTHEAAAPYLVFDLESTQTAATAAPLDVLEWDYGGFAMRGRVEWRDTPADANMLASDGLTRSTGDGASGRWCFLGGSLDGGPVGLAALGHPANFRAPQKMRIHESLPYAAFSPVKDGDFSIEPGAPYVTRLRFVTVDGAPDEALFNRLWDDYATPPDVTVTPR